MGLIGDRLRDQVALITGGSRGIGLAAARGLASRGATVVLVGRDEDRARAAAADLMADGLDAVGLGCDVADSSAVRALPGQGAATAVWLATRKVADSPGPERTGLLWEDARASHD